MVPLPEIKEGDRNPMNEGTHYIMLSHVAAKPVAMRPPSKSMYMLRNVPIFLEYVMSRFQSYTILQIAS